jgi:hypothetical protein
LDVSESRRGANKEQKNKNLRELFHGSGKMSFSERIGKLKSKLPLFCEGELLAGRRIKNRERRNRCHPEGAYPV